jgi:nucleoside-diphosphate-sugar epimerase
MRDGPILVLGAGYTGRVVQRQLTAASRPCFATFRNRLPRGNWGVEHIHFDLDMPDTWRGIPPGCDCVWTFPAEPPGQVEAFAEFLFTDQRRVVVIGTTSSYLHSQEDEVVAELSPLDLNRPRVQGEELLRSHGAMIVRAAGLYGPGRNPLDWLRRGVPSRGENFLNLIHVEDLADALVAVLDSAPEGEHYCASDGIPRRWRDIAAWARERGYIKEVLFGAERSSKKISNAKLLALLRRPLAHADLFRELDLLEGERLQKGQP